MYQVSQLCLDLLLQLEICVPFSNTLTLICKNDQLKCKQVSRKRIRFGIIQPTFYCQNIPARRRRRARRATRTFLKPIIFFLTSRRFSHRSSRDHNLALKQGKTPHISRWFSRGCVDSQANFGSLVALIFALVFGALQVCYFLSL